MTDYSSMDLAYDISGAGEPLLLIHGIISDRTFFSGLIPHLANQFQCLSYDRPGYGNSVSDQPDTAAYSIHDQADAAWKLLLDVFDSPAWIIGNSAGGLIALDLALRHSDMVKGIILMETPVVMDSWSRNTIDEWYDELKEIRSSGRTKRVLPLFAKAIGQNDSNDSPRQEAVSFEEMKRTYHNLSAFLNIDLDAISSYETCVSEVQEIKAPVHILVTDEGRDTVFGRVSSHAAELAGWPVSVLTGNHNTLKDHPAKAADLIKKVVVEQKL